MSLVRRALERRYTGSAFFPPDYIPSNGQAPFIQTGSGYGTSSEQAMRHAAVYACVRLISDQIASFPCDAYIGDIGMHLGEAERVTPKPIILTKPSAYLSGVQWLHQVMMSLLQQGNAYGLISARDRLGYPTQIDVLDPQHVTVDKARGNEIDTASGRAVPAGTKVFKMRSDKGGQSVLTATDVWHCPGPMMPGALAGLSPIQYAARTIGMGVAAEQFGLDFFQNGVHPTAVATSDQPINQQQAEEIKDKLRKAVSARDFPVLGLGTKLEPWTVTPEDSMLLEVQRVNQVLACQFFGVPPEMIGAASRGSTITYANREQRAQDFLNNAINPWLVRLEDSFSSLFPRTTFVKFDTKALLKSDLTSRYTAWQTGINAGFLLPEEARQFEDLPEADLPAAPQDTAPPTVAPPAAPAGGATNEGPPA